MSKIVRILEKIIPRFLAAIITIIVAIVLLSLFDDDKGVEAPKGSFSTSLFNEGWDVYLDGEKQENCQIPGTLPSHKESVVNLINTLPNNLHDGMSIMFRTTMEDIYVYIDGEERISYCSDKADSNNYYPTSAYEVCELSKEDAGKKIEVVLGIKNKGILNDIYLSNGNNSWFSILQSNMVMNVFAIVIIALGIITMAVFFFLKNGLEYNDSVFYLGLLMMDIGLWMLSESRLRQLIFHRPTLTSYISYLTIESIGAFVVMYFDSVQHRKYHKQNVLMELIICLQLLVNIILYATGIVMPHDSLMISHMWMAIGIVLLAINIFRDIHDGSVKNYKVIAIGMGVFILMCLGEIVSYYRSSSDYYGIFVGNGLLVLLTTTIVQLVMDVVATYIRREKEQGEITTKTLETIASSIDAKDEYTGGHSNRVGKYAAILAREMAPEYGFSEEDIVRINYIGLMHDIGKIGVSDPILNKPGKLTSEEFTLMEKHVDIGYELLNAMGNQINGLLDGIRFHHERYDGNGYPDGLQGENIPLIARILCIADCYDAMTSNRVYRKRLSDSEVRNEYIRCRGTQFDPKLTDLFIRIMDRGEINPDTIDGMEIGVNGKVLKSSALDAKLAHDLRGKKKKIPHPEHIRMMCYILKLMENKGDKVDVVFVELDGYESCKREDGVDEMSEILEPYLKRHDINIEYTKSQHVIAMFNRNEEEINLFNERMSYIKEIKIEYLM